MKQRSKFRVRFDLNTNQRTYPIFLVKNASNGCVKTCRSFRINASTVVLAISSGLVCSFFIVSNLPLQMYKTLAIK